MSDAAGSQSGQASMGRCLAVFGGMLIAAGAGAAALAWALPRLPLPGGLGVVVLLLAAGAAGHSFARRTGRRPTGAETASFAMAALLLALAFALAVVWAALRLQGLPMGFAGVAAVFIRDPAAAAGIGRQLPFLLELAPWLALVLLWLGFRLGVGAGLNRRGRAVTQSR